MFEEPYRWVEAVGNRRQYLDEQLKQGSPVVALSYRDGILLLTLGRGTPKLYEIYDRIGMGGMGHPADLEKLRFTLLETAHLEGFNRSPADVTVSRLMKYVLAPAVKQAFEEVFKAPYLVKVLLAELRTNPGADRLLTLDYDGSFEERPDSAVLAAPAEAQQAMRAYVQRHPASEEASLSQVVETALCAWAVGSLTQQQARAETRAEDTGEAGDRQSGSEPPAPAVDAQALFAHLNAALADKTVECALLDRRLPGSSKYRVILARELKSLAPPAIQLPS